MEYEIVEIEKKDIVGIKIRTTNENWKCIGDMTSLWQKFFGSNVSGSIKNATGRTSYGVYNNYESDLFKPYDYTAGLEVGKIEDLSGELSSLKIPGGKYAKFSGMGDLKQVVGELWQKVWASEINRSYLCDFELYNNKSEDMDKQEIEIYISIK